MYVKLLGASVGKLEKVFSHTSVKGATNVFENLTSEVTNFSKHFGKRIEALNAYKNPLEKSKLFFFKENGEISVLNRGSQSADLKFLDHVKTGNYTPPRMNPEGTYKASKKGIDQSNKLAQEIIPADETLVDGFRYHGPKAKFNEKGQNISRFRNGDQEIAIVDRTIDPKLSETIKTFKSRLNGKTLSEQEKVEELLKYVDEVFSVKPTGAETEALVNNMHSTATKEVLLGDIINSGAGVCRHRSLLTKVLGDEVGLKTSMIQGYYGNGGHAWNEITTTKGETFLFDAMHGSIFNVSNTSKSVMPQSFHYKITDPQSADRLVSKYFNPDDMVGVIYRKLEHGQDVNIKNFCDITPSKVGNAKFTITPNKAEKILVNGYEIKAPTQLHQDDWVQIKSLGFQIR